MSLGWNRKPYQTPSIISTRFLASLLNFPVNLPCFNGVKNQSKPCEAGLPNRVEIIEFYPCFVPQPFLSYWFCWRHSPVGSFRVRWRLCLPARWFCLWPRFCLGFCEVQELLTERLNEDWSSPHKPIPQFFWNFLFLTPITWVPRLSPS